MRLWKTQISSCYISGDLPLPARSSSNSATRHSRPFPTLVLSPPSHHPLPPCPSVPAGYPGPTTMPGTELCVSVSPLPGHTISIPHHTTRTHARTRTRTRTHTSFSLFPHSWKDLRDRPGPRCRSSPRLEQGQSRHAALRLQTLLPLLPSRLWAISTCECVGSPSCFLLTFFKPLFWSLII